MESLLRRGREIQREAIRLRGGDGAITAAGRQKVIRRIRPAVKQIERDHQSASAVVRTMRSLAQDLE
jgi:hypothetical protein